MCCIWQPGNCLAVALRPSNVSLYIMYPHISKWQGQNSITTRLWLYHKSIMTHHCELATWAFTPAHFIRMSYLKYFTSHIIKGLGDVGSCALFSDQRHQSYFYPRHTTTEIVNATPYSSVATPLTSLCGAVHFGLVAINFPHVVLLSPRVWKFHHELSYTQVQHRKKCFEYSYYVRTIPLWNSLPNSPASATSINNFQRLAAIHCGSQQP